MSIIQENIVDAFQGFEEISKWTSINSKQDILLEHKDNEVLKTLLYLAYSPYIQYNIKKIPLEVNECQGKEVSLTTYASFLELSSQLSKREITGNDAIEGLSEFLVKCCPDEYKWYTRIIGKDLAIGLADKGINKAFKGLIPVYDVMLADKVPKEGLNLDSPKVIKMLPDRIVTQVKIDGYRLNIFNYGDSVEVRTRNGKYVLGYNNLEKEVMEKLPVGYVYDGEMTSRDLYDWIESNVEGGGTTPNRDLFSEAMSHAFSNEDNKDGIFNLFDMVPISEWNTRKPTESYEVRVKHLQEKVSILSLNHIRVVPTSRVYYKENPEDLAEIVKTFHEYIAIGWEGLMLKNWDSVYEFKRTKNLLKMKLMDELDLEVVDVFEGEGKYKGMLGGVYVDYKGYKVGVGSGWKDNQREYYWSHKNEIIGKTIAVAYQAETSNKDGGLSLSFPVVKAIRLDK